MSGAINCLHSTSFKVTESDIFVLKIKSKSAELSMIGWDIDGCINQLDCYNVLTNVYGTNFLNKKILSILLQYIDKN